jgi:hypothetical protein
VLAVFRFVVRHLLGLIGAPLIPFVAVAVLALLCAAFGTLYWIPKGLGSTVAGLLFILPLVACAVMAVLLAGLALAWPLMHASVATEGEDAFDALSRSYSYLNQRLVSYIGMAALAWLFGILGVVLIDLLTWLIIHLAAWGISFSAPHNVIVGLRDPSTSESLGSLGRVSHRFWLGILGLLAHGWIYSYFWTASTLMYLFLRRDVDGVPWNVAHDDMENSAPTESA